ncbi:MAG: hypothetical protein ABEJ76_01715 [Halanaeroarchaeum sp.]
MVETCTYCGSDLTPHDTVSVREQRDGETVLVGRFCNYACLAEHIEEAGLTAGACCYVDPERIQET